MSASACCNVDWRLTPEYVETLALLVFIHTLSGVDNWQLSHGSTRFSCTGKMLINKTPSILLSGLSNNSLLSLSCEFLSSAVVSFAAVTHDNCKWAVLSAFFCNHGSS